MKKTLVFLAASLLAACGGSASGTVSSNATVNITSPTSGSSVALGADAGKSVPVTFTLTGYTLMAAGTCGGQANCGHLHLRIDDDASPCNNSAGATSGDRYNVQVTSGTAANAQFAVCGAGAAGTHSITLEVADDSHHLVVNSSGNPIASTVTGIVTH
jgi:hypothetical protein